MESFYSNIKKAYHKWRTLGLVQRCIILFVVALIIRLAFTAPLVMELDTHFYAKMAKDIAQNVKTGKIFTTPPVHENYYGVEYRAFLYPLLTALLFFVTGGIQWALIAVSLICGSLAVIPVYLLTMRFIKGPGPEIAAFLIITHPRLVFISSMGLSESLYVLLFISAVYFTASAAMEGQWRHFILAGITWGLAYLTRFEAFAGAALAFIILCSSVFTPQDKGKIKSRPAKTAVFVVAVLIIMSPYLLILKTATGGFHLTPPAKQLYDLSEGVYISSKQPGGYREFVYRFGAPGEHPHDVLLKKFGKTAPRRFKENADLVFNSTLKKIPENIWVARSNFSWFWILMLLAPVIRGWKGFYKKYAVVWVFFLMAIPPMVLQFWDPSARYFTPLITLAAVMIGGVGERLLLSDAPMFGGSTRMRFAFAYIFVPLSIFLSWHLWMPEPFNHDFMQIGPLFTRKLAMSVRAMLIVFALGVMFALIAAYVNRPRPSLTVFTVIMGLFIIITVVFLTGPTRQAPFFEFISSPSLVLVRSVILWLILICVAIEGFHAIINMPYSYRKKRFYAVVFAFALLTLVGLQNCIAQRRVKLKYRTLHYNPGAVSRLKAVEVKDPGVMCAHPFDAFSAGGRWVKLPLTADPERIAKAIVEKKPDFLIIDGEVEALARTRSMRPAIVLLSEAGILTQLWKGVKEGVHPDRLRLVSRLYMVNPRTTVKKKQKDPVEKVKYKKIPWKSFRGDLQNTGRSRYKGPSKDVKLQWRFKTGHENFSSPVIDRKGNVYFGCDDSRIYSLDRGGNLRWKKRTGYYVSAPASLSEGRVYVGSNDQNLYCLTWEGKLLWKFKTGYYISSGCHVLKDMVIFGGEDGRLYCLDPSGKLKWKYNTGDEVIGAPALSPGKDRIYVTSKKGVLTAVDMKGKKVWVFNGGKPFIGSPAVDDKGVVYAGCTDGRLYAVSPEGKKIWSYKTGGPIESSPALAKDGTVYIGSKDSYLYALSRDGKLKWKYKAGYSIESSPVVDAEGNVYFGSHDRSLHGVTPEGAMVFKFRTRGAVVTTPALAPDGSLSFGSLDKYFYRIK